MITIEYKLIKSRNLIFPVIALTLALIFMSFVDFWIASGQKHLEGKELAAFVSGRAFQSGTLALFFIFWILQMTIHLKTTGFYKMLLVFGWSRNKLFLYAIFKVGFYAGLFMMINFLCYSVISFLYTTNPLSLLRQTDFNSMFSQYFYLFIVGSLGCAIGFLRSGYIMVLPVFIYWLLEGWLSGYLHRKLESPIGDYFPLQSLNQLVAESLLGFMQIGMIAFYSLLVFVIMYSTIQKKMFL